MLSYISAGHINQHKSSIQLNIIVPEKPHWGGNNKVCNTREVKVQFWRNALSIVEHDMQFLKIDLSTLNSILLGIYEQIITELQ